MGSIVHGKHRAWEASYMGSIVHGKHRTWEASYMGSMNTCGTFAGTICVCSDLLTLHSALDMRDSVGPILIDTKR
jgi:hypothetical protein